jgi:hypothetical protein
MLVEKPEEKGKPVLRWEDNIKMYLREIGIYEFGLDSCGRD